MGGMGGMGGGGMSAPYGMGGMGGMGGGGMPYGGAGGMSGGGGLVGPGVLGMPALGAGLRADQLELDPSRLFERMLAEADVSHNQKLALAQMLVEVGGTFEESMIGSSKLAFEMCILFHYYHTCWKTHKYCILPCGIPAVF